MIINKKISHAIVSWLLVLAIFVTSLQATPLSFASETSLAKQALTSIQIPEHFGTVEESYQGTNSKTIIYIQDAHDSLEAQENIANIIQHLVERYGIKTVYEEGYEGPVPTDDYFRKIEDPKIREKVAYFLMDKLRIGGAEYAHINQLGTKVNSEWLMENGKNDSKDRYSLSTIHHSPGFRLIGIDSFKLHDKNIEAYAKAARFQKDVLRDLTQIESKLQWVIDSQFSNEAKVFLKSQKKYQDGALPLLDYLRLITHGRGEESQSVERILNMGSNIEKKINFTEFRSQMQTWEDERVADLLNSKDERIVYEFYKTIQQMKKLCLMRLSSEDFKSASRVSPKGFTQNMADVTARLTKQSVVLSTAWEGKIRAATEFYQTAHLRDLIIHEKLKNLRQGDAEETSALVFGGFHKDAIKGILKDLGYSYLIVTPKIKSLSVVHKLYYKNLLSRGWHEYEMPLLAARANRPRSVFREGYIVDITSLLAKIAVNPGIPATLLERGLSREMIRQESRAKSVKAPEETATINLQQFTLSAKSLKELARTLAVLGIKTSYVKEELMFGEGEHQIGPIKWDQIDLISAAIQRYLGGKTIVRGYLSRNAERKKIFEIENANLRFKSKPGFSEFLKLWKKIEAALDPMDSVDAREGIQIIFPKKAGSAFTKQIIGLVNDAKKFESELPDVDERLIWIRSLLSANATWILEVLKPSAIGIDDRVIKRLKEMRKIKKGTIPELIDFANVQVTVSDDTADEKVALIGKVFRTVAVAFPLGLGFIFSELIAEVISAGLGEGVEDILKRFSGVRDENQLFVLLTKRKVLGALAEVHPSSIQLNSIGIEPNASRWLRVIKRHGVKHLGDLLKVLRNPEKFLLEYSKKSPKGFTNDERRVILAPMLAILPQFVPLAALGIPDELVEKLESIRLETFALDGIRDAEDLMNLFKDVKLFRAKVPLAEERDLLMKKMVSVYPPGVPIMAAENFQQYLELRTLAGDLTFDPWDEFRLGSSDSSFRAESRSQDLVWSSRSELRELSIIDFSKLVDVTTPYPELADVVQRIQAAHQNGQNWEAAKLVRSLQRPFKEKRIRTSLYQLAQKLERLTIPQAFFDWYQQQSKIDIQDLNKSDQNKFNDLIKDLYGVEFLEVVESFRIVSGLNLPRMESDQPADRDMEGAYYKLAAEAKWIPGVGSKLIAVSVEALSQAGLFTAFVQHTLNVFFDWQEMNRLPKRNGISGPSMIALINHFALLAKDAKNARQEVRGESKLATRAESRSQEKSLTSKLPRPRVVAMIGLSVIMFIAGREFGDFFRSEKFLAIMAGFVLIFIAVLIRGVFPSRDKSPHFGNYEPRRAGDDWEQTFIYHIQSVSDWRTAIYEQLNRGLVYNEITRPRILKVFVNGRELYKRKKGEPMADMDFYKQVSFNVLNMPDDFYQNREKINLRYDVVYESYKRSEIRQHTTPVEEMIGLLIPNQITADDGKVFSIRYSQRHVIPDKEKEMAPYLGQRIEIYDGDKQIAYVDFKGGEMWISHVAAESAHLFDDAISVDLNMRKKYRGIGRSLMAMVFTISKSAGYERFNVNGVNKDEAKTFYRGLGLQPNPDNPGVYSIRLITDDRTQIINGPEIKITARSEFRKPTDEDLKKFFERVQTVVAGLPGDLKKITVSYQLQAQREVVEHFGLIDDVVMSVLETYDRRGFMVGEEIGGVDGQPSRTQYWINPEATGFRFKALLELIAKNLNLQSGAFEAIDDQAVADILNPDTEEPEPVLMVQDTQGWQLLMEEYQKIDNERIVRQEVRGRGRKNLIDKPESDISRIAREASKSVFYVDASAIMKGSDQADQLVKELAQLTNLGAKVVLYHLEKADTNQVFYARLKSFPRGTFVERVGSFAEVLNETRQGYSEFNLIKYETDSKFEGANAESFPSVGDRLLTISGNSGAGIYSLRALAALKLKKSIPDLGIEYRKGFHFIADGQSAASALLLTARFAVAFATSA